MYSRNGDGPVASEPSAKPFPVLLKDGISKNGSGRQSLIVRWRNVIVESELDSKSKLVGLVLTTWMNSHGECWPAKESIARRASIGERSVYTATRNLVAAGFLEVEWSRGGSSHRYRINPASVAMLQVVPPGKTGRSTRQNGHPNPAAIADERAESAESVARLARLSLTDASPTRCEECGVGGGSHAVDCSLVVAV
jgi:hypothetical protein